MNTTLCDENQLFPINFLFVEVHQKINVAFFIKAVCEYRPKYKQFFDFVLFAQSNDGSNMFFNPVHIGKCKQNGWNIQY